ncbi:MAG: DUF4097 family beta strand repeat-containing protein [Acidobacteriota bacterium]
MRKLSGFLLLATLVTTGAATAHDHDGHRSGSNMNIHVDADASGNVTDCNQVVVEFDGQAAVRADEELRGAAGLRALHLHAARNGGIRVSGWDGSGYTVKACKAVALASDLASLKVSLHGDEVTTEAPEQGRWIVFFLVQAPRGATLDLESHNGEISIRNLNTATLTVRAQNGPISLRDSSGSMDVETHNGPISLVGGSGNVKLAATNGPVTVKLSGTTWEGGQLEARTQNGPLSLRLPAGYRSGVVVESSGHGPLSCRAEACGAARRSVEVDDDNDRRTPRRLEFGGGAPVVHLSTMNGPVSIKDLE